jgi:hypothetical protein
VLLSQALDGLLASGHPGVFLILIVAQLLMLIVAFDHGFLVLIKDQLPRVFIGQAGP